MKLGKANQKSKGKERTFETQITIELQGPHGDKKKNPSIEFKQEIRGANNWGHEEVREFKR